MGGFSKARTPLLQASHARREILSFGVGGSQGSVNTSQELSCDSHKDVRLEADMGNGWLLRKLTISSVNSAHDLQPPNLSLTPRSVEHSR